MPQNTHLDLIRPEADGLPEPVSEASLPETLREKARSLAQSLSWLPNTPSSNTFSEHSRAVKASFRTVFDALGSPSAELRASDDFRWLHDNARLLYSDLQNTAEALKPLRKMPHVRIHDGEIIPRTLALAEEFLGAASYQFSEQSFRWFVESVQESTVLNLSELWAMVPVLKLVLLEQIALRSGRLFRDPGNRSHGVGVCLSSLRDTGQTDWKALIEPLILFDQVLRRDPAGSYPRMDFDSRDLYRKKLSNIAAHSDCSEMAVAREVLALAEEAQRQERADPRVTLRDSHVGYYLNGAGIGVLQERVGFRPPFVQRIRAFCRKHPDTLFLPGIEILTLVIMSVALLLLTSPFSSPLLMLLSMLMLLLPCSQSAVQLMNSLATTLLPPEILPKLDFSEGISSDCVTMVAVPSLLLNQKQVHRLVDDLEVRFLGNHDPYMHFALLTDLADSREPAGEDSALVDLCAQLIRALNEQYAGQGMGSFFLLHRYRVYNPRERAWMGWERKRGKLMDLNRLLCGQADNFPVKVGDLSILQNVRFVITLDSDTELPRGSAQRMVGVMAHPLHQAIIDPEKNIVVSGYGILQPRVGLSVQSAARSRLAAIYAGETGFDIYTRAVSDVYQDLYGEGIFTGKGIYEVAAVHHVLDRRFPRNNLLSHDLIEGAYARAGLVSDIEVIEDYPSHYSAYNRRKHRWLRGDWQITAWLFRDVKNESGASVRNPISLVSRWKILDNLRRSLVEPATFFLLLFGWLVMGQPAYWTVVVVCILLIPAWWQLALDLVRAACTRSTATARDGFSAFLSANINVFFMLTFLAHQTLLALDAVTRALVRRVVTHYRLLEWETAAEAELGTGSRGPMDIYLDWIPALALGLGLLVGLARPHALPAALPILLLWACSKRISAWLNRPPVPLRKEASKKELLFLRRAALHTWRYFAEFSSGDHNWLIPDNVQEQPPAIAARMSPTNLGLLLNARQVACEFGYLTVSEFAEQTLRTLESAAGLRKFRGHLLNWYDTRTLEPLAPQLVSSVDSGNLMASLWTLQQGCLDRLRHPIVQPCLSEGLLDHLRVAKLWAFSRKQLAACEREQRTESWLQAVLGLSDAVFTGGGQARSSPNRAADLRWFAEQSRLRLQSIRNMVRGYAPWLQLEFAALREDPGLNVRLMDNAPLSELPAFLDELDHRLALAIRAEGSPERASLLARLRQLLPEARANISRLISDLRTISGKAGQLANDMDFGFLLDHRRKLMSVGFEVESERLHAGCYDLLATESRTAVFAAIAKEDIPQESWFLLGRAQTLDHGRPVLLSWTGTSFEYLMPSLWMRSYPNTLLDRSRTAAVRSQQAYALSRGVPWGISESAYFKFDDAGNYQYHAFGLPHLALHKSEVQALVISPYSTFLALDVDPSGALSNLRRMSDMGWFGSYGFYEAADYSSVRRRFWQQPYQLVRCWMAHHQGMSLLALGNFLHNNIVQQWFHSERRVQATELLLHERPVSHLRRADDYPGAAAA